MMTDDEAKALGERAVGCTGWRWMAGMSATLGDEPVRVVNLTGGSNAMNQTPIRLVIHGPKGVRVVDSDWPIPDLRDAATVGCLLAIVREAYGMPGLYMFPENGGSWRCYHHDGLGYEHDSAQELPASGDFAMYATEAEALIAALEGAP